MQELGCLFSTFHRKAMLLRRVKALKKAYLGKERRKMGHFGFSYIGMIFLCMLFVPNIIWAGNRPKEYTAEHENKILLAFERTGEGLTCCCALLFSDFNLREMEAWAWWLAAAFFLMVLYEYWWIRYFHSRRSLEDFYSSLWGIPVAGATLPVMAFFCWGCTGRLSGCWRRP